ncbi:IclR family transcriptional regulator [Spirabiliibacterium falconis]|uniref:IclR family transcriptional regulator n=1 Tax=Spirabiliibacterium falconis TaxID=572023 RepID=UPI001AACFF09|nr:IclR family transcriptional regulator [Spirabiliibacterium falconis]MBE2893505.1 IclR family transcriptional regulator [Spirabiliibacterium falconis]
MNETKSILKSIDVLEAISVGHRTLTDIQKALNMPKTTVHRTLKSLETKHYIRQVAGIGYVLGTGIIRLGIIAQEQMPLKAIAHPYLEKLARSTQDTVHLGIREGDYIFYLDKISGSRQIEMRSRIGDRLPLAITGIGKALMLDLPMTETHRLITQYAASEKWDSLKARMQTYRDGDFSFDLEDNCEILRCVAVPIRNKYGHIIAAISVASISVYMPEERMYRLVDTLKQTSQAISNEIEHLSS